MINMKYCKVQIHELGWFNHSFIIFSPFLTMPKKAKIGSINISKKWKTWYTKSESKKSIFLFIVKNISHYHLIPLSVILFLLGKSRVEHKILKCISGHLTYHSLLGPPKYHSLLASHPSEPHPTDQSSF